MKDIITYINEVHGWTLDDEDWQFVNNKSDGKDLYAVKIWWGSGYLMDCYAAYADNHIDAINYTVLYIEQNNPKLLEKPDKLAHKMLKAIEKGDKEADDEFDEMFLMVDALDLGANDYHYIYTENLFVDKFPKNKMPKQHEENN